MTRRVFLRLFGTVALPGLMGARKPRTYYRTVYPEVY